MTDQIIERIVQDSIAELKVENAQLRQRLKFLVHEAEGLLQTTDSLSSGMTHFNVLKLRLEMARAALSEGEE